ncbi:matrix metalloproteinase-28 [Anolis carolinensis]|uniref:matrix metalloproteinase-28 n=1 Tax=Anolis carolinensis TaxID=28377 RepID=UPI002F2B4DB6
MAPFFFSPSSFFLVFLVLPSGSGSSSSFSGRRTTAAKRFLEKYGYLDPTVTGFSEALRAFQRESHLDPSGSLDAPTLHQMTLPRCGNKGRVTAWTAPGPRRRSRRGRDIPPNGKWHKRHLTFRLVNWPRYLPPSQVRWAVQSAFQLWSNVSGLVFWESEGEPADIRLTFFQGDHNDGADNAFDGPGGALAHAFFPLRGEAHFDSEERWALGGGKGRNLFLVVAHEIGHTLGLAHSPVRGALMSPYYKKLGKGFLLNWDDILAVQDLYGKPSRGPVVQLPGKLFARFPEIEEAHREEHNLSAHYCWSFFDAIATDPEDNVVVFKGGHYWTVSEAGGSSGPHPIQVKWPGMTSNLDAATFSEEDGKFYFFKGGRCWRYRGSFLDDGFPQKCSGVRGGGGALPRHPDTALFFRPLGQLVLFKGPKYFVVDGGALQVEPYYPRSLRDWRGVPVVTNGALTRPGGSVYFFRNDRFWEFDPEKLRVVGGGKWVSQLAWLGCQDVALNRAGE